MDMAKAVLVLLVPVLILFGVYVFFFGGSNVDQDRSERYVRRRARLGALHRAAAGRPAERLEAGELAVPTGHPVDAAGGLCRAATGPAFSSSRATKPADTLISARAGQVGSVGAQRDDAGGRTLGVGRREGLEPALVDTEAGRTRDHHGQAASQSELQQFAASLR